LPQRRIRALARDGFLLLAAADTDLDSVEAATTAIPGPVRAFSLPEIDPEGALTNALAANPGEVWVVRPDAHVAAVLTQPTEQEIAAALRRAVGYVSAGRDGSAAHCDQEPG
jgi:pentachlorophenol monooxygenase/3-(3-hydroxy-phenyl)propionate hydroxylase